MAALSTSTYGKTPDATMDVREGDVITLAADAPIPEDSKIDCAIAGLFRNEDGTISAEIFIPGPAAK